MKTHNVQLKRFENSPFADNTRVSAKPTQDFTPTLLDRLGLPPLCCSVHPRSRAAIRWPAIHRHKARSRATDPTVHLSIEQPRTHEPHKHRPSHVCSRAAANKKGRITAACPVHKPNGIAYMPYISMSASTE